MKKEDPSTILINSFAEVFLSLVLTNRISQEQFELLLKETERVAMKNLNDAIADSELELAHLRAQLKPYDQKN